MFKNNKIYKIDEKGNRHRIWYCYGLNIKFKGRNSIVELETPLPKYRNCLIKVGSNCHIKIGASNYHVKNLKIFAYADNTKCYIGKDFSLTKGCEILLHKENNLYVQIGNDCMFASNIVIRTSDVHSLIDLSTNKVTNCGGNIDIGNHCWIAANATVLKNVKIADNCVIGTGSIVTKNCLDDNSIYAGIPAKKIKADINWLRETPTKIS